MKLTMPLLVTLAVLPFAAPAQAQQANMSFFVTSAGPGNGANLGGLSGAARIARNSRRRPVPVPRLGALTRRRRARAL